MTIQLLTLLTPIVAVISNLLSVNEKFSKIGIVGVLKMLSYYVLPILFIQQILQVTYSLKYAMSYVYSIFPIILVVYAIVFKKKSVFDNHELLLIIILAVASFFFILQPFSLNYFINGYANSVSDFFQKLGNYKISEDMYIFLSNNLLLVFWELIDSISLILFAIVEFKTFKYFYICFVNKKFGEQLDYLNIIEIVKYTFVLCFLSSGALHLIIEYICSLF